MATACLFEDDAYRRDFVARVIGRLEQDGHPGVALYQTCFYPASGGQVASRAKGE